jgi:hypothetical protein
VPVASSPTAAVPSTGVPVPSTAPIPIAAIGNNYCSTDTAIQSNINSSTGNFYGSTKYITNSSSIRCSSGTSIHTITNGSANFDITSISTKSICGCCYCIVVVLLFCCCYCIFVVPFVAVASLSLLLMMMLGW